MKSINLLKGKRIVVTAGPTYEPIDPVRFIGNHSSGKMGIAIAEAAANLGAVVTLITGPTSISVKNPSINRVSVMTAEEMYLACLQSFPACSMLIMAAAVADYRPVAVANEKIKKNDESMTIELVKNRDILASLSKIKNREQLLVGFALETENELSNAFAKLERKDLDMIVLNSLRTAGAGFGVDTNKVTMIDRNKSVYISDLKSKGEIAIEILERAEQILFRKALKSSITELPTY
jgi:phosphopantothenoylcysteine decarboxylase / phosphopantothenate---cysteine ligase